MRFEQLNRITDMIGPTLPSASHVAVLHVAWRHAGPRGHFSVSTKMLARQCRLSNRQAGRLIDDLERLGVIKEVCDHKGPIPKRYQITGRAAANGDTHDAIKSDIPPAGMVTPTTVNGDTHDR